MHHIFEAQVPCVPLSDCGQDLTDFLYPFQPTLLNDIGKSPWRIQFQANYYQPIKKKNIGDSTSVQHITRI